MSSFQCSSTELIVVAQNDEISCIILHSAVERSTTTANWEQRNKTESSSSALIDNIINLGPPSEVTNSEKVGQSLSPPIRGCLFFGEKEERTHESRRSWPLVTIWTSDNNSEAPFDEDAPQDTICKKRVRRKWREKNFILQIRKAQKLPFNKRFFLYGFN